MSSAISNVGVFLNSLQLMGSSETILQQLQQQNATGLKSTSLAGYGAAAGTVLDLQSGASETQGFIDNNKQVSTYLSGYDTTLTQLQSDASQLSAALANFDPTDSASVATLSTLVAGLGSDVTATLNTEVGDRYIYAGGRYSTAPAVDLSTLAAPTTPSALTIASGNTIPDYDVDYAATGGTVASGGIYYNQQQVTIAKSDTISYGVSADDPAIQQLVYSLQQAKGALAATSTSAVEQFKANAQQAATAATTGLTALSAGNAISTNLVSGEITTQTAALTSLQDRSGDLTQVDPTTVATELSAVENQLQGSYKATSMLLNLSLLTYLS